MQGQREPQQPGHEARDLASAGEGQKSKTKCRGLQIINTNIPRAQELSQIARLKKGPLNYVTTPR